MSEEQLDQLQNYLDLLTGGNRRANLISATGLDEVRNRHFLDSLTLAAAVESDRLSRSSLLDVGSGAGLPGIPIAIAFPNCKVTLLEVTGKKVAFLQTVKRELGLANVTVAGGRAEGLAHDSSLREGFDIVVSRAVARLATVAELMLPFCRVDGVCVAYKGLGVEPELTAAASAIKATGGGDARVVEIDDVLVGGGGGARLVVIPKIGPTPVRYPRREGIPRKRPL